MRTMRCLFETYVLRGTAALVLLGACMDGASRLPTQPSFDVADNPTPSPSAIVIRRDGIPVRIITVDPVAGLMAIHGPTDDLPVCNNLTTRDTVDGQQINTPSDVQGIRLLLQAADTHVSIYAGTDISQVFPFVQSQFCAFIANTPTLYEGVVGYHVNLGSSMTSFRWEGDIVSDADGSTHHYVERQDVVSTSSGNVPSYIRIQ